MGAARSTNGRSLTRCCRQRSWNTAVQCAGPRCQPAQGTWDSDLHGPLLPYKRKEQHLSTCNGHAQPPITHRDAGADPHAQRRACTRPGTKHHTHHTDLLVWNEAARAQLGGEQHAAWWQPCAGRIQAASRRSRPIKPTTTSRRCHGHRRGSNQRFKQGPREAPQPAAWVESRSMPPTVQPHALPAHMGQHHLHGRITCLYKCHGR
jgi:hypothetical protein